MLEQWLPDTFAHLSGHGFIDNISSAARHNAEYEFVFGHHLDQGEILNDLLTFLIIFFLLILDPERRSTR